MPEELFKNIFFLEGRDFDSNSLLFIDSKTALIDPGFGKKEELESLGLKPDSINLILLTHAHADHFASAGSFRKARILASKKDALKLAQKNPEATAADFFQLKKFPEAFIIEEKEIKLGSHSLKVISTPGHSDGGISFYEPELKLLACGDLFFFKGIGRFDLPSGNEKELMKSISLVEKLDLEIVIPGHGPIIRGRQAIEENFEFIKGFF